MKILRVAAVCALAGLWTGVPGQVAQAQMESREAIDLQNQIAELRQELQMMQQAQQGGGQGQVNYPPLQQEPAQPAQIAPGQSGGGDTAAELLVRVSALEEQVRSLQGKVDDLTNQMQHQRDDLTKQIGDLAFKLGQGPAPADGGGLAAPPPDPALVPAAPPPQAAAPPSARRTAEMALHEGNAALARRDYAAAAAAAREVLAAGKGVRLTDAQFLLARAENGLGQFKASAADYYKAYQRAPKSPSAPVALLGVANALADMNDKRDSCEALAKLATEFPQASGIVKQNAAAARKRAGCGR
jgi:TolA-binding protein